MTPAQLKAKVTIAKANGIGVDLPPNELLSIALENLVLDRFAAQKVAALRKPEALKPRNDLMLVHASYLSEAVHHPETIINRAGTWLNGIDYDTMVGRGLSGAMVLPWLARALGKAWMIVRKEGDGSHSTEPVEGALGKRWLFVDDLISSGDTMRITYEVVTQLARERGHVTEFVGAWTYGQLQLRNQNFEDPSWTGVPL